MFVNTNVSALQSVLDLQNTTNSMDNVLQQLSSGYQINSAADNPAGLAISQQMQTQIDGLNQAQQNTQAGISLLQTADGALSNIDSILQSMRSLASQAATGTNNATDSQALQSEMNQYAQEITNITNTTQFNTLNLLSGAFGGATGGAYNSAGQYVGGTQTPLQSVQIGANQGQELTLGINPLDSVSLGVAGWTATTSNDTIGVGSLPQLGAGLTAGTWTISMIGATQATVTAAQGSGVTVAGTYTGNGTVTYTITGSQQASSGTIVAATNNLSLASVVGIGACLAAATYQVEAITYTQATATAAGAGTNAGAQTLALSGGFTGSGTINYTLSVSTNTFGSYLYTLNETGGGNSFTETLTYSVAATQLTFQDTNNNATVTFATTTGITTSAGLTDTYAVTVTAASASFQLETLGNQIIGTSTTIAGTLLAGNIEVGDTSNNQTLTFSLATTTGHFLANLQSFTATVGSTPIVSDVNVTAGGAWQYQVTGSDGFSTVVSTTITGVSGANTVTFTDGTSTLTASNASGFTTTAAAITATAASAQFELLNSAGQLVGSVVTVTGYSALSSSITAGYTGSSTSQTGQLLTFTLGNASTGALYKLTSLAGTAPTTASATVTISADGSAAQTAGNGVVTTNAVTNSGLNIENQGSAASALSIIDQAITIVDQQRANIGAYQNRLQFASSNASTGSVNLSAAQAGIMDTNMALQMANLSKYQVLQQSGIAMLAQADQIPQALLKIIG